MPNDWTATQSRVNFDVFAQAPLIHDDLCIVLDDLYFEEDYSLTRHNAVSCKGRLILTRDGEPVIEISYWYDVMPWL